MSSTQRKRVRVSLSLSGNPEAVAAAAEALERLLGSATVQFGLIAPSQRREGQAHIGGGIWVVLDRDERGPGLREHGVAYLEARDRDVAAAHAEASAEAMAIVELLGERGDGEVAKPDPHDGPVFRCEGCGKAARLLIADRHGAVWCRVCQPEDSDDPPPAGVVIPLPPRKPDHDMGMGMAVADARMRVLWDCRGTAGDLVEWLRTTTSGRGSIRARARLRTRSR